MAEINPYAYDGELEAIATVAKPTNGQTYWIAPEGVTLHSGQALPANMLFPLLPPPEIGEVLSAESRFTGRLYGPLFTLYGVLIFLLVVFAIQSPGISWKILMAFCALLSSSCTMIYFVAWASRSVIAKINRRAVISYVATHGAAIWTQLSWWPNTGYRLTQFDFSQTDYMLNYQWHGKSAVLFQAVSLNQADEDNLPEFYYAAERAWTEFWLARWKAELKATGFNTIHLGQSCYISVFDNRIGLHTSFGSCDLETTKIIKLAQTFSAYKHYGLELKLLIDPRLSPRNQGRFIFPIKDIPNARGVLLLLPELLGVPLQGKQVRR